MEESSLMRYAVTLTEMRVLGKKGTKSLATARKNAVHAARVLDVEQYGHLVQVWNDRSPAYRRSVTEYCHAKGHAWRKGPFSRVCIRCCATGGA